MNMPTNQPQREPSAALRKATAGLHEIYVGLVQAGFNEEQALTICSKIVVGAVQ